MKLKIIFAVIVALMFVCVLGCNQETETDTDIDTDTTTDAENDGAAEVAELTWTEEPTLEMIPDAPVKGEANGAEFIAADIYFEPRFGNWRLVITDKELPSPDSVSSGGQSINIDMPEVPRSGSVFIREMQYGDGYFQIRKKDNPEETTSWNADNAYAIEITDWKVDDYDPAGGLYQVAGKASGRVFIAYNAEGWPDFENSWAAGTFTDVPVRYLGEPDLD